MFLRVAGDYCSLPARIAGKVFARNIRSKTIVLKQASALVTFTFDDVPASACETGAGILESNNARGTFYVAGAGCGSNGGGKPRLASFAQLQTIWEKGHEIGCHTYSHLAVSSLGVGQLDAELERNRAALQNVHRDIVLRNFAYPYGDLSFRGKRHLEGKFDSCRSVLPGINRGLADLGALKACPLEDAATNRGSVAALVAAAVRSRGWLIFYSHDVALQPDRFGVSPGLLAFAVATAREAGCAVCTVGGALDVIGSAAGAAAEPRPSTAQRGPTPGVIVGADCERPNGPRAALD